MSNGAREEPSELVEHHFRREYARLVAVLTRAFGLQHLQTIEDAVQSALLQALESWSRRGVPQDPGAWVYRVAHNAVVDQFRRTAVRERSSATVEEQPPEYGVPAPPRFVDEIADDQLRMLFVCCDEAIPAESQLVLALKVLCGFSAAEIALRLFTSEANVHKRLARARQRLREVGLHTDTPPQGTLKERLPAVQQVIYLIFNEGYASAQADTPIRRELCEEAIRLGKLLVAHPAGDVPGTRALLALMHLHAARLDARLDATGGLILLADQDRGKWNQKLIRQGLDWLERSASGDSFSRYHAEAGIAAEHCLAATFEETRWTEIAGLYQILEHLAPSPLHTLNRAIALAQVEGPARALAILTDLRPPAWLFEYYLWDAALGELWRQAGEPEKARTHLHRALQTAPTQAERQLIKHRLDNLEGSSTISE